MNRSCLRAITSGVILFQGCSGLDGKDAVSTIVATSSEPAGDNCPSGGIRLDIGADEDGNGSLEASEIESTEYVCSGSDGSEGLQSLVVATPEDPGANCATGGQRIDYGIDDNGDGVLDAGEVEGTTYACNGTDGSDGLQSLVAVTPVAASFDCPVGGQSIDHGIDDNDNGVLDPGEIDGNAVICVGTCQSAPFAVIKDFTNQGSFSTPVLDQDEVTITGAPGSVNVLNLNGLGVVGGANDSVVDGSESLTYEFVRPALNVSYSVGFAGNGDGNGTVGDALVEAFGADGESLGTANVTGVSDMDVSQLFGGAAISSFVVTALIDSHRVGSLTFTTCD